MGLSQEPAANGPHDADAEAFTMGVGQGLDIAAIDHVVLNEEALEHAGVNQFDDVFRQVVAGKAKVADLAVSLGAFEDGQNPLPVLVEDL